MRLRPHQLRATNVPRAIVKQSRKHYDKFPDPDLCWEQSKIHINHFINHLKCPEIKRYHERVRACKPFDDFVANCAGDDRYRITFFTFYGVSSRPAKKVYTEQLVTNESDLRKLAKIGITKKYKSEIEGVPDLYDQWPEQFNIPPHNREDLLKSIEACIKRRLQFRNACIRDCCKLLDKGLHDLFLLITQILRARIIVYS